MDLPKSARGIYAVLVAAIAITAAVFAATFGGALVAIVLVVVVGHAIYVLVYRADQRVRNPNRSGGGE